jgi:uncharacterized membrane protein YjfL (UPF0719 family)
MIDSSTLLQTDAMVIAGILIFLTIYRLDRVSPTGQARRIRKTLAIVIVAVIVPFCFSAMLITANLSTDNKDLQIALWAAHAGFVYLAGSVVVTVMLPFLREKTTTEEKKDKVTVSMEWETLKRIKKYGSMDGIYDSVINRIIDELEDLRKKQLKK